MKARDLMGMQVGTLTVIAFDEERHKKDLADSKAKIKNKVKRYWLCECSKCGQIRSVETSNLLSGNTKGCICDKDERTGIHNKKLILMNMMIKRSVLNYMLQIQIIYSLLMNAIMKK